MPPGNDRKAENGELKAAAIAHPNIAFIKYWGNADNTLNIPLNGSISMNLGDLVTRTEVAFQPHYEQDTLSINDSYITGASLERVSRFLDIIRELSELKFFARITSETNFPIGAGIASSAAAFAALCMAAAEAAGLKMDDVELSRLARRGSGSACRSIPPGFVEWHAGAGDQDSCAYSIAPPDHWDLVDCIAIVQTDHKSVSSSVGHALAHTSPLLPAFTSDAVRRLADCRKAILERDFDNFAGIVETDSNLMHAVMITSTPPIFYWEPASLVIMKTITRWREKGLAVCYTLDAGPNVHVLTTSDLSAHIVNELGQIPGVVRVITSKPGGEARLQNLSSDQS